MGRGRAEVRVLMRVLGRAAADAQKRGAEMAASKRGHVDGRGRQASSSVTVLVGRVRSGEPTQQAAGSLVDLVSSSARLEPRSSRLELGDGDLCVPENPQR